MTDTVKKLFEEYEKAFDALSKVSGGHTKLELQINER